MASYEIKAALREAEKVSRQMPNAEDDVFGMAIIAKAETEAAELRQLLAWMEAEEADAAYYEALENRLRMGRR